MMQTIETMHIEPEAELSPCPFCGAEPFWIGHVIRGPSGRVEPHFYHPGVNSDTDCVLSGQGHSLDEVKAWNTRSSAPQEPVADDDDALPPFVRESNRIEGINETTEAHIKAHRKFLGGAVTIPALVDLVTVLQPNARFRNAVNIPGVRVGNHVAPPSGPNIEGNLRSILAMRDPWEQHIAYETLHPFTDGNGRSGRAVWLHRHWHEDDLDAWAVRRGFLLVDLRAFVADRLQAKAPETDDNLGASASPSGSCPSDQAPAGLAATRFDPSRKRLERIQALATAPGKYTGPVFDEIWALAASCLSAIDGADDGDE